MVLCNLELQRLYGNICLTNRGVFNGDLFGKKDSVPSRLFHLISLTLDRCSILDDYNANSKNTAVNIGQNIKFNP